jgi:hypothetical protein
MRIIDQMQHVDFPAREIIIHTDNVMTVFDQTIAKMGTEKAGSAGNKSAHGGDICKSSPKLQTLNFKRSQRAAKFRL